MPGLSLFLQEPKSCGHGDALDAGAAKAREVLLGRFEDVLKELILQDRVIRNEAKVWLTASISLLKSVSRNAQRRAFLSLLPKLAYSQREYEDERSSRHTKGRPSSETEAHNSELVKQLMLLLCESAVSRRQVAKLLGRDAKLLRHFFRGDNRRIVLWFQHFAGPGGQHKHGARALARYAFAHREECWHELAWSGWHSQSPAMVASKPHYFLELQVVPSVQNLLNYVPAFWDSDELRESLESGEFLSLDYSYFADELQYRLMESKGSGDRDRKRQGEAVLELVEQYLAEEDFNVLCRRLLHLASPDSLLTFLRHLEHEEDDISAEVAAIAGVEWPVLDDALLANACSSYGRQVMRLLTEEERSDTRTSIAALVEKASNRGETVQHWSLRREGRQRSSARARKWLLLESFLLRWKLHSLGTDSSAVEDVLTANDLEFERVTAPSTAKAKALPDEDSKTERKRRKASEKSSRKRKKKRQKRDSATSSGSSEDESMLARAREAAAGELRLREVTEEGVAVGWKLKANGFRTTWSAATLVDFLVDYSLNKWLEVEHAARSSKYRKG